MLDESWISLITLHRGCQGLSYPVNLQGFKGEHPMELFYFFIDEFDLIIYVTHLWFRIFLERDKNQSVVVIESRVRVFTIVTLLFCLISGFWSVSAICAHKDHIDYRNTLKKKKFFISTRVCVCVYVVWLTQIIFKNY